MTRLPFIVLYSLNTLLAWRIANRYYGDRHFVWCTPHAHSKSVLPRAMTTPPSSCPLEIAKRLKDDILGNDRHSAIIRQNCDGIMLGADINLKRKVISSQQRQYIYDTVAAAQLPDFSPLLYVIPLAKVIRKLREVPPNERAHSLSWEYQIETLMPDEFDVVEL